MLIDTWLRDMPRLMAKSKNCLRLFSEDSSKVWYAALMSRLTRSLSSLSHSCCGRLKWGTIFGQLP
jgi:hypothetical protein